MHNQNYWWYQILNCLPKKKLYANLIQIFNIDAFEINIILDVRSEREGGKLNAEELCI